MIEIFWIVLGLTALAYIVGGWELHEWLYSVRDELEREVREKEGGQ